MTTRSRIAENDSPARRPGRGVLRHGRLHVTLSGGTLVVATFNVPPPQVTQYYHVDMLGSVRAVTDATGGVLRRYDYAPFGEEFVEGIGTTVPADGKQPRFAGKERDAETFLDYFEARYYRNLWGRFTTVRVARRLISKIRLRF